MARAVAVGSNARCQMDIQEVRLRPPGGVPPGLERARKHRFGALTEAVHTLKAEGRQVAGAERQQVGLARLGVPVADMGVAMGAAPPLPVVGVPPGPDVQLARANPAPIDHSVWRSLEKGPGINVGDAVVPSVHFVQLRERGLDRQGGKDISLARSGAIETREDFMQRVLAGESLDARILPVQYNKRGERERTWSSVLDTIQPSRLSHLGLSGPRTSEWCLRFLQRQQLPPEEYHLSWRTRHRLSPHYYGVEAHQLALKAINLAGTVDQLDLPNLSIIESLFRQVQMIEHYYREKAQASEEKAACEKKLQGVAAVEQELFLGSGRSGHEAMVAPDLMKHISTELEREALISKQARKAREERSLARS
eukprot:6490908-Amphidinium_carterae.2